MDLTNLRQHHEELINHMKNSGYSMSCIYMYRHQIREILELDMESWTSYKDIYQYFESVSANQKDLKWRRSVIGGIEHFDHFHLFPDRRRICSFIEPRGAYYSLNPDFQQLIDHYKAYAEKLGKTNETTIDNESHGGAIFFYHLQQRGCSNLESVEENDVLSYFLDESGNLIRSAGCCKNVRAVLKAGVELNPADCKRVLLLLPHLTEHRKNIQVLTDDEIEKINLLLSTEALSLRDKAIMSLLLHTGIRGVDIINLKLQSVHWNEDVIRLVQSKTRTELELPLRPNVGNAIYDYIIEERPTCSYATVFISEAVPHEPLKVQTIRWLVRKVFKLADIRMGKGERIGTHLFRHNLTIKLLEKDTALPVISNILGHASPKSVDPYLHTDFKHLKECALSIEDFPIRREVFDID
ncbi:MAG: tyrosine-type recombinase/integrase [Lachnospiraceae bacterium]|nr:tyrosine-type recombinase/integrase [Lachnospiraceae bacterium]